jgi:hypothetical protein
MFFSYNHSHIHTYIPEFWTRIPIYSGATVRTAPTVTGASCAKA